MQGSCQARRHQETSPSPHLASLLRHASSRGGRGSAHHSDPVRPSRSQRDHHLPASFATSSPRDRESSGLAEAERLVNAGGVDEPAAPRGGRSHPQRRSCLHRTKSPVAQLEAHQSTAGHCALSYLRSLQHWLCRTRKSSTICCSAPVRKHFSKLLAIRDTSARKSASSPCCILGIRSSGSIPMS